MQSTRRLVLASAGLAALAPRRLVAQAPPPPLVRAEGLHQVTPHVWVIPDNGVPLVPNVGFVVGDRAALVVDTGLGARNGAAVAAVAARLAGSKPIFLVTTHVHPEHDLGAHAFPEATTLLRSRDQLRDIEEFGLSLARVFAARSPINAELLDGAQFRPATTVFESEHEFDLGGVRARIMALGANHTGGDTGIWVEPDRVLFSGDVAMAPQPAFASPHSSLRHWLTSLDRLEALRPGLIVPSHGPTGDAGLIAGYRAYLTEVRDRTAAEKRAGRDADAAVATVTAAMARYPDRGRLEGAIRKAFAEAS
ncbi:MBL fold metallo-hydrolase [Muricoccus radiodurans]|uniref:MBL fold metallo-hydrolase n=1 Tax=Muricoccus radiodurans TaxID=2231721 RepID=UPI003CE9AB99